MNSKKEIEKRYKDLYEEIYSQKVLKMTKDIEKKEVEIFRNLNNSILENYDRFVKTVNPNKTQMKKIGIIYDKMKIDYCLIIESKENEIRVYFWKDGSVFLTDTLSHDKRKLKNELFDFSLKKYEKTIGFYGIGKIVDRNLKEIMRFENYFDDIFTEYEDINDLILHFTKMIDKISVPELRDMSVDEIYGYFDTKKFYLTKEML